MKNTKEIKVRVSSIREIIEHKLLEKDRNVDWLANQIGISTAAAYIKLRAADWSQAEIKKMATLLGVSERDLA